MSKAAGELSVFVDESGSFDSSCSPSRFYIVTFVLHDQSLPLDGPLSQLDNQLAYLGLEDVCLHAGPLIRREEDYRHLDIVVRRKLFGRMVAFARSCPIGHHSFVVDKKYFTSPGAMQAELSRQMCAYVQGDGQWIGRASVVKVYYDNGQAQVKGLLKKTFADFPVSFPSEVTPGRYRLFQVADLVCTLELLRQKLRQGIALSRSEDYFFEGVRALKKNFLKPIARLAQ